MKRIVEVPQFLRYPLKVHGLTGRQFLILIIGIAVGASCWQYFESISRWFSIIGVGSCVVVIMFVRVYGRGVEEWIVVIVAWMLQPNTLKEKSFLHAFQRVKGVGDDGIVEVQGGGYLAVVEVQGHVIKGNEDRFMEEFSEFLSGLSFPLSLLIRMRLLELPGTLVPSFNLSRRLRGLQAHYLSFLHEKTRLHPSRVIVCFLIISASKREDCTSYALLVMSRLEQARLSCRRFFSEKEILAFYQGNLESYNRVHLRAKEVCFESNSGCMYGAGLALAHFPGSLSLGWLMHFVQQQEEPYEIRISLKPVDDQQLVSQLERKAAQFGGALLFAEQNGQRGGNRITKQALKEVELLREQLLLKKSHIFASTFIICLSGPSRLQIRRSVKRIRLFFRSLNILVYPLHFQHHLAFLTVIYGHNFFPSYTHLLPTEVAASLYPFIEIPYVQKGGVLLGALRGSGDLVSIDLHSHLNSNLAVLGVPGSGKSFFLKTLCSRFAALYPDVSVMVIDIEGEYASWAETVGAGQIIFSADSLKMNAFSLVHARSLREKLSFLVGLVSLLVGEQGSLSQYEKAHVMEALLQSYAQCGITDNPDTHSRSVPTMADFVGSLMKIDANLGYRLEMYQHLFPSSDEIDEVAMGHQLYILRDLPLALRPITMYLIIERLSSLLYGQHQGKHLLVIDEAWFLSKFDLGAIFLNEFARRARKYNVGLWLGTQQVQDLLATQEGNFKGLLDLCETKVLFRQEVSIGELLRLDTLEENFLRTAGRGEALYITSKERFELKFLASDREKVFARGANKSESVREL